MRDRLGRFQKGHSKPKNAWGFPSGNLNPAKRLDVRKKLSNDKLGIKNPMFGVRHSESFKKVMSEKWQKEKNPRWKGGITLINEKIRKLPKYKAWRKAVFERDNYTCIICSARNGNGKKIVLNADHIKPFSIYPKLRFNISNGRTLCVKCHLKIGVKVNQYINIL